ncbi:MAG: creatininase family protein [Phycisphaerae bacterium]|nr:creatininase family protein [Phycisphaerae bacterium]
MLDPQADGEFETRYEWMRPGPLQQRRAQCPLILFPLGPLEYHGPHLPLGTDPINATYVAHACCRKLRRGVVRPTMYLGTERERDPETLESLGFERDQCIVGMDFPSRQWNSHYLPEEVFALVVGAEVRCLIAQGYKYVFIVNGHGAVNHNAVLERLCAELSRTTPALVDYSMAFLDEVLAAGAIGHADSVETSLMMHYHERAVDLGTLPSRDVPLAYADFSIVDGPGFTPAAKPNREVPRDSDPRWASAEAGKGHFERTVAEVCGKIEKMLSPSS